jgi:fused signal recognition particle receptor
LSLWQRLKKGLSKTSTQLTQGLKTLVGRRVDAALLDELEEALILADFGVHVAAKLRASLEKNKDAFQTDEAGLRRILANEIRTLLKSAAATFDFTPHHRPHVLMFVGVNGSGKTTTMGKLTHRLKAQGHTIEWVAGDTFRSAAVEQLEVWARRNNVHVYSRSDGGDAAGLVFDGLTHARANEANILMVDTAGRLQNKEGLMQELDKIKRVMRKIDATAPHHVILVLDATTGQNAYNQVEAFHKTVGLTGLVITKLDGTAKGGIILGLWEKFHIPIYAIGVGEGIEDLQPFNPATFSVNLLGIEEE